MSRCDAGSGLRCPTRTTTRAVALPSPRSPSSGKQARTPGDSSSLQVQSCLSQYSLLFRRASAASLIRARFFCANKKTRPNSGTGRFRLCRGRASCRGCGFCLVGTRGTTLVPVRTCDSLPAASHGRSVRARRINVLPAADVTVSQTGRAYWCLRSVRGNPQRLPGNVQTAARERYSQLTGRPLSPYRARSAWGLDCYSSPSMPLPKQVYDFTPRSATDGVY